MLQDTMQQALGIPVDPHLLQWKKDIEIWRFGGFSLATICKVHHGSLDSATALRREVPLC
jgi:hypothetical protein